MSTIKISKEFNEESQKRIDFLKNLPRSARIHIVGVCGTGTSGVLKLFKDKGFYVSGSDKAFYPPMGDLVKSLADKVFQGYSESNLSSKDFVRPDFVVFGNSVASNNPEVEFTLKNNIPFASMPEVFSALLVGDRDFCPCSIVVSGTHGKTTTTSIIAYLLETAGLKPGFFIGGAPLNLESGLRAVAEDLPVEDRTVVLEGDEYDSSFYAKYPKFHSYRPDILVITNIEFDHADIYENLAAIEAEFSKLVRRVPENGFIIVNIDNPNVEKLANNWYRDLGIQAEIITYGKNSRANYQLTQRKVTNSKSSLPSTLTSTQQVTFSHNGEVFNFETPLSGEHNALNLLASFIVANLKKLTQEVIEKTFLNFVGAKKRQEVIADFNQVKIIEDFGHHPTAIKLTLDGMKERFKEERLIAVLEPRSNTGRRDIFREQYQQSFNSADLIIILEVEDLPLYNITQNDAKVLDVPLLVKALNSAGKNAKSFGNTTQIKEYLLSEIRPKDVVVFMSNGDFGGIAKQISQELPNKFSQN